MFEWCLRYSLDAKLFPQASHMNGFSPNTREQKVMVLYVYIVLFLVCSHFRTFSLRNTVCGDRPKK